MKSRASSKFWRLFHQLPPETQRAAVKNYGLWLANHWHPSLHFKKIRNYWVVRVSENYRAVGVVSEGTIVWFWIGPHDESERLVGS